MTNDEGDNYICVHCGTSLKSLYKQYSPTVLKLCNCTNCGNVADKYLEYDKVIILIDLILFSKEAYRHVFRNMRQKNYIKLAILQLIMISIDEWFHSKNPENLQDADTFFELGLYLVCFGTVIGKLIFLVVILLFLSLHSYYKDKKLLVKSSLIGICRAIIFSSFGYFLLLTVLIWDDFQREIRLIFIHTYTVLSNIQALTVTTKVPKPLLGAICAFAKALEQFFYHLLKWCFES